MIIRRTALARERGFSLNDALAEAQFERLRAMRVQVAQTERDALRLGLALSGDQGFAMSWLNSSLLETGAPRDATREAFALFLARLQLEDGRWRSGPPASQSNPVSSPPPPPRLGCSRPMLRLTSPGK